MSQLQAQLRKIAVTGRSRQPKGYKASLLFDARQAAETDIETIYALGINGLEELKTHKYVLVFQLWCEVLYECVLEVKDMFATPAYRLSSFSL